MSETREISCEVCSASFTRKSERGPAPRRCQECCIKDKRLARQKTGPRKIPDLPKYTCERCGKEKWARAQRSMCGECSRTVKEQAARSSSCRGCGVAVRDGRVGFCECCRPSAVAKGKLAYTRTRRQQDPFFMLMERMRSRMKAVRTSLKFKTSLPSDLESALGYKSEDLREHIEGLFAPGMTWEDLYSGAVHIDHKRPVSSFDWSNVTALDHNIKECWALSNLQPLWAVDNLRKGARWAAEVTA